MSLYQKLVKLIYLPHLERLEKDIGCKLVFRHVPDRYINAMMSCDMTKTWQKAGLDIVKGQNYFTIGKVVNGTSTRFDRTAMEYQSWLGGYTVKLASEKMLTAEDHFKLAIADQNDWLSWYGDPHPATITKGFKPHEISQLRLGPHVGELYEFGCTTHSDVGIKRKTLKLRYAATDMAALFNLANKDLKLTANAFVPKPSANPYETLGLKGFIAIFDIKPKVKTILYGNGTAETFAVLKQDLLSAMKACEIMEV